MNLFIGFWDNFETVLEQIWDSFGTVWASFDGARTWPVKRLLFAGSHGYSALTSGRPGTKSEGWAYLHFEGGPKGGSTVARFNLAWVLGGEATGDGSPPELRSR